MIFQAQADFLREVLSKKETSKQERDMLAVVVTQVQQQLQQHEEKEQQLNKEEKCKEDQQPHFDGKGLVCSGWSRHASHEYWSIHVYGTGKYKRGNYVRISMSIISTYIEKYSKNCTFITWKSIPSYIVNDKESVNQFSYKEFTLVLLFLINFYVEHWLRVMGDVQSSKIIMRRYGCDGSLLFRNQPWYICI